MKKILISFLLALSLTACGDKSLTPNEVAEQFWQSAQQGKLESAKQLVSWQTVGYLKYFRDDKFTIKRVEFGESTAQDERVEIDTILIIEKKQGSDVRLPTKTVLIKTENVWRVQLKQTLAAVINQTINAAANQFNRMIQEGMSELNKALSGSINEISQSLEEGAKELGQTLEGNAKQFGDSLNQLQQELEKSIPKDTKSE
ncbi:MAG TPA: hypothetical protein ENI84_00400 [Thiothrix sp.]|nr:hypothetical protein [Thiothrix sp.]